jgi:hypothetical protein
MKKLFSLALTLLLISNVAFAQSSSDIDVKEAVEHANQGLCQSTQDLKAQIDQAYSELGKIQMSLDEAKNQKPYVEKLNEIRKASAVSAVISAAIMAYTYNRGRISNFKSPIIMTLNEYALAISSASAKVTGFLALATQTGYMLTSSDIREFQMALQQSKEKISQLQKDLQSCDKN